MNNKKLYTVLSQGRHGSINKTIGQVYAESREEAIKKVLAERLQRLPEQAKRWIALEVKEWA